MSNQYFFYVIVCDWNIWVKGGGRGVEKEEEGTVVMVSLLSTPSHVYVSCSRWQMCPIPFLLSIFWSTYRSIRMIGLKEKRQVQIEHCLVGSAQGWRGEPIVEGNWEGRREREEEGGGGKKSVSVCGLMPRSENMTPSLSLPVRGKTERREGIETHWGLSLSHHLILLSYLSPLYLLIRCPLIFHSFSIL